MLENVSYAYLVTTFILKKDILMDLLKTQLMDTMNL